MYLNIYVIMKTMCPPGYHHNHFVATYAHLASVGFEHSVCRGSLMTTYIFKYIFYIYKYIYIYIGVFVELLSNKRP